MASLKVPVTEKDHIQGNKNAPITFVEYGDYQCPYCGLAYPIIKALQEHFGDQLRFVFRNFPLGEIHPFANVAAQTAEFAADSNQFWQMHDLIYENQSHLSLPLLMRLTKALGLSMDDLETAITQRTFEPKVKSDFLGGVKSGVNGTPTFFINGERYNGGLHLEELISAIESTLVK